MEPPGARGPTSGAHAPVIRRPDGRLYALSAVCTHAGCDLEYRRDARRPPPSRRVTAYGAGVFARALDHAALWSRFCSW
jgi:Rieske Fe-S protein